MKLKVIFGIALAAVLFFAALMIPIGVVATSEETQPEASNGPFAISDQMMTMLKQLEGFNAYAYWDYSQWSIGYGSLCPAGMEDYYQKNPITLEYAEQLLRNELDYFEGKVNGFIQKHNLLVTQHQYDALVSFSYNTGAGWTSGTTGNFNSAVIAGDTGTRFIYGMMLWSMAGSEHILIGRRIAETNVYANGVYEAWTYPDRYRIAFMNPTGGSVNYDEHGFDALDPVPIRTKIKSAPVGPDENGAMVTYVFDGWYTAWVGGTRVDVLDESIPTGTTLYAHWKTPSGTPVVTPRPETGMKLNVTVTGNKVNVRTGPNTYYASVAKANKGDVLEIVEVARGNGMYWGRFGDNWISLDYTNYSQLLSQRLPMWGKVTSNGVNVRTGAGTNNATVPGVTKNTGDVVLVSEWKTDGTMMWGKIAEGWIALPYVTFENVELGEKEIASVILERAPTKLSYVHKAEAPDTTGGRLLVTYKDNTAHLVAITPEMVTSFDNTEIGPKTVIVTYKEYPVTFDVEIVKAKVVFQMDDGTVISEGEYLYGDAVVVPENPTKPADSNGYYTFAGWDKEVTTCTGDTVYKAVFELHTITGDCNKDGQLNDRDAIFLLWHTHFPDRYPIAEPVDYNKDGQINDRDAIYLLWHTHFPDRYPLS